MKMQKMHRLKTWLSAYADVRRGAKTFEFRRNDRDFQEGDKVALDPWDPDTDRQAPYLETVIADVGYVLRGPAFGVPEGYCVFPLLNACTADGLISAQKAAGHASPGEG